MTFRSKTSYLFVQMSIALLLLKLVLSSKLKKSVNKFYKVEENLGNCYQSFVTFERKMTKLIIRLI